MAKTTENKKEKKEALMAAGQKERRFSPHQLEIRNGEGDNPPQYLFGYTAKFNDAILLYEWSDEKWYEVIEEGFFDDVLDDDVRCLYNHDSHCVLARNKEANNLQLKVDKVGLWFEAQPDTRKSYVKDLMYSVENKEISQCSFAFTIKKQAWEEKEVDGILIVTRRLQKGKRLYDVGPVTYPAYPTTEVGVKSHSAEEFEKALKEWRASREPEVVEEKEETGTTTPSPLHLNRERYLRLLEIENQ